MFSLLKEETIGVAILILVPGFIAIRVFHLLVASGRSNWSEQLIEVFSYGTINYATIFWLADLCIDGLSDHPIRSKIGLVYVLFINPTLLAIALRTLIARLSRYIIHPAPTAWDYFFGRRRKAWAIVRLKSGERIVGLFGPRSYASSSPNTHDIYLEETWKVDDERGALAGRIPGTQGVLIRAQE